MKYKKEYIKAVGNKERFMKIMCNEYPKLKKASIHRRFYDLKKSIVLIDSRLKGALALEYEYKHTTAKSSFIKKVELRKPNLKESSIIRYYNALKKMLGNQPFSILTKDCLKELEKTIDSFPPTPEPKIKVIERLEFPEPKKVEKETVKKKVVIEKKESKFEERDKTPLNDFKRIQWEDMKRLGYGKNMNREKLTKYGFYGDEINWLIDAGEIEEG